MADVLGLGIDTAGMAASALNIAYMIALGLVAVAIIGVAAYLYMNKKRYDEQGYKVIIYSQDGFGQIIQRTDKASIFVDKITKNKRLYVKGAKVGLEADNFPYVMGDKGKKTVYLLQTGLKNFRFIRINIDVPKVELKVGEEDVNWAINEFDRAIKMFETKSFLKEWGGMIALVICVFAILILMIFVLKKFDVLQEVAKSLENAAASMASAHSGTMVIGG